MENRKRFIIQLLVIIGAIFSINSCSKDDEIKYEYVEDIEGNKYNTIKIGSLVWMAENLKTTTYNNGSPILQLSNKSTESNSGDEESGTYGIYQHSSGEGINSANEMIEAYGIHYNWYAVIDERGLCPDGWKVPSIENINELIDYIKSIDNNNIGDKLKSCRYVNSPLGGSCDTNKHPRWDSYKSFSNYLNYGTDDFGFSALPAGSGSAGGTFLDIGKGGYWWSSTEESIYWAKNFGVGYSHSNILTHFDDKRAFYSIRCVKEHSDSEIGEL